MPTLKAADWKRFYEAERASMGEAGLLELLDRAPRIELRDRGALVFPHTRLGVSGRLTAAAALAVVRSGASRVLALGVLHGARAADSGLVARARGGDARALRTLRRVHGPGVRGDEGRWAEEFSLDGFAALVALAAGRAGVPAPEIVERYPLLVGGEPESLPGMDELRALLASGCALVATTDPVHHGAGYGTPPAQRRPQGGAGTARWARDAVRRQFGLLERGDYAGFQKKALACRSDFRDTGPVLAALLGGRGAFCLSLKKLVLVGYSDVLGSADPTWVAAALACAAASRA